MSKDVYAAVFTTNDGQTVVDPVIPFSAWGETRKKADASWDAVFSAETPEEHDALHEPNPEYIPGTHINMADGNAETLFQALGMQICEEGGPSSFPIGDVLAALMRRLNSAKPLHTREASETRGALGATFIDFGVGDAYVKSRMEALLAIVVDGVQRKATHIAVS